MPQTNVIIEIHLVLSFTLYNSKNIAHDVTEKFIFYADKIMVMDSSKNLCIFNIAILLKSQKSRKFDACEIYMFYSIQSLWITPDTVVVVVAGFYLICVQGWLDIYRRYISLIYIGYISDIFERKYRIFSIFSIFIEFLKIIFNVTHRDYVLIFSLCVLLAYDLCYSPSNCSVGRKSQ